MLVNHHRSEEEFIAITDLAGGDRLLRRSEIRQTGQFTATSATGVHYRIVQLTRVTRVVFRDLPEQSTDGDTWYRAHDGQLVQALGDDRFEIITSRMLLQRVRPEKYVHPMHQRFNPPRASAG